MTDVSALDLMGVAGTSLAAAAMLIAVVMPGKVDRFVALILGAGWLASLLSVAPESITSRIVLISALCTLGAVVVVAGSQFAGTERVHVWVFGAIGFALPFRVPIQLGDNDASLLVPLYVTICALFSVLLARDAVPNLRDRTTLDIGVGVIACLMLMSVSWAYDLDAALVKAAAFVIPFCVLYLSARKVWTAKVALAGAMGLVGAMSLNAAVGIYQHATKSLWQNAKVQVANEFGSVFRVNGLFFDPNIFGRYLVASILVLCAILVFRRPSRRALAGGFVALLLVHLLALWWTYSQSSLIALSAGTIMLSAWLGNSALRKATYGVVATASICGAAILMTAPGLVLDTGRREIASTGITLASLRPVHGLGLGSFEAAVIDLAEDRGGRPPRLKSSHTTPITMAAEQGVLGVGALLLLLATATAVTVGTAARNVTDRGVVPGRQIAAAWGAATLLALVVHSLFYASFVEDPLLWIACAALAGGARLNARSFDENHVSDVEQTTSSQTIR